MAGLHVFLAFLLNAIVQISLVAGIAWVCVFLAGRARAWVRHAMWVLALLVSALLPLLSLAVVRGSGLSIESARWKQIDVFRQKIDRSLWLDGEGGAGSGTIPGISGLRLPASVLAAAYLLFVVYRLGYLFLRWRSTQQMLQAVHPEGIPERVMAIAEECKRRLGGRTASMLCSQGCAVPFTAGVFRPIVVLPEALLKTASDDELRAGIGHELAHIGRHDYPLNLIYEVISLPVAFHPGVPWMKRQIEKTREAACDEIAAGCLPSSTGYARALVNLARALPQPPFAPVATSPALGVFDGNNLEERIMQLLDQRPRLNPRAAGAVLALSILIFSATCVVGYNLAFASAREDAASSAAGQSNVSGTWTGQLSEKLPDGRVEHGSFYLRLQQSGDKVTGVGGDTEANARPIENLVLNGNHVKFSATASGGPKGSVAWTVELDVKGDAMEGKGHAFRSADNHSWDVEIKLARNK